MKHDNAYICITEKQKKNILKLVTWIKERRRNFKNHFDFEKIIFFFLIHETSIYFNLTDFSLTQADRSRSCQAGSSRIKILYKNKYFTVHASKIIIEWDIGSWNNTYDSDMLGYYIFSPSTIFFYDLIGGVFQQTWQNFIPVFFLILLIYKHK